MGYLKAFELNHEKAVKVRLEKTRYFLVILASFHPPRLLPKEFPTINGRRCRAVVTDQEWWQLQDNQIHVKLLLTSTRTIAVCMSRLSNVYINIDVVKWRRKW